MPMHSVFQFDRSEHAFANQPLSIQNLADVERPHNPWNTAKCGQVKLARAVWTRYRMPNCHPEGNEPLGQKSIWASKLRQNDFLSPHTICTSSSNVCLHLGHACTQLPVRR